MAYYFIFPEKDATLYSHPDRNTTNTGNDEILEIVKERGSNNSLYYPSRILVQFSDLDIKNAINLTTNPFTASLQLFSTEHKNLSSKQFIEVYPISESWHEGTGRYTNLPTSSNGCSWKFRDNSTSQTKWATSSFSPGTTGSILPFGGIELGGGSWYTGSNFEATQSFTNAEILDLNINVTSILQKFSASLFNSSTYPIGIPNNGFLLKNTDNIEENVSASYGTLSYFSVDTHTIYPPKLAFKWDDSIFSNEYTSSGKTDGELNVTLYNNKEEYNQNEIAKIRINVRDKYPTRTFVTSSNFLNIGYFTTSSFYSIRDAHTEEEIIPFDDICTKLSADSKGMYFNLYINGLQPERYYRILFKHINNDGTQIYDDNYHFKVIR